MWKRYPNVKQHDASDCAAAAVATVLLTYKQDISIMKIREIIGTDAYGTSVKGIVDGLETLNFDVKAVRVNVEDITSDLTYPMIAQVRTQEGLNHFVVIHKVTKKRMFLVSDPGKEVSNISEDTFLDMFMGVIVLCIPRGDFEQLKLKESGMFAVFSALILPQKKLLITTILASCALSILGIVSSLFSKVIMDEIIPNQLRQSLYVFLVVFALIAIVQNILSFFRQHVLLFLSRKIDIPLLLGYYNHILHLPYTFFVTRRTGDILTRFQDAMTVKEIFTSLSISLILDIVLSLISAIVLWNLNATLFMILVCIVSVNMLLIYVFKRPYKKLNYEQMEASARLNSHLIESVKNFETVKAMANETQQIEMLESRYVHALKIGYKEQLLRNIQGFVSSLVGSIGNLVFMGVGALLIIDQSISLGDLLVFQTISQYFTQPVQNLVSLQITFQEAHVAMKRLSELMSLDREDHASSLLGVKFEKESDISFEKVKFAYGSRPPVLKNLSFTIKAGSKIALVGESGSGKSTVARLLTKFVSPSEGKIRIGGDDLQDVLLGYLRSKIAYIPQNVELFTGSILDNLRIGNPNATYEQIVQACRCSGADTFIERMPNRYGAFVEEGGGNLSGGEKQRLAIARAVLMDPDVYIFDEITSNLDSFSEGIIHDLVFNQIQGKTIIIIAHRLSTIVACDQIFYMRDGCIKEQGTHDQLLKKNSYYARMIQKQQYLLEKNVRVIEKEEIVEYE